MQYVRSISGSVSKTWNSINPATLSGAIDVIVVELEDGTLVCSPFHVRFGKFSLLRPSEKKVQFKVNDVKQDYAMKLGDGGEAFFVFESSAEIPEDMQTSPLISPASSPQTRPSTPATSLGLDSEPLDLTSSTPPNKDVEENRMSLQNDGSYAGKDKRTSYLSRSASSILRPGLSALTSTNARNRNSEHAYTDHAVPTLKSSHIAPPENFKANEKQQEKSKEGMQTANVPGSTSSTDSVDLTRAINLSKKLWSSKIPTQVTDNGDLMLDMTGYKSDEDEALRAEVIARRILSEELEGNHDIGSLIGADEKGNLWIYRSEEAKFAAGRQAAMNHMRSANVPADAVSDPGYQSDDSHSISSDTPAVNLRRRDSDSAIGMASPADSSVSHSSRETKCYYAKTLRLTNDQLKALSLKPGANPMSFSVNRATCQAVMYFWKSDAPIVISDIDGTITKSDALGHVLNMLGRDWTHQGVAKLYTDIVSNGYNILYLTSRSVGQADTTRAYLSGVIQDGNKLPKGPVIMSPDRTMAALRREVYLRKPEVFKMACLRDILSLFGTGKNNPLFTPFYAGFGNRLTDALSYRSVNIPSTRIFTINSESEVSLDLLSLNGYKTGYVSMRELVDYFFPPVSMLVGQGAEDFTDFNYWREKTLAPIDFSASESYVGSEQDQDGDLSDANDSLPSEDEGLETYDEEGTEDLERSYMSRDSVDELSEVGSLAIEKMDSRKSLDSRKSMDQSDASSDRKGSANSTKASDADNHGSSPAPPRTSLEMSGASSSVRPSFSPALPEGSRRSSMKLKDYTQMLSSPKRHGSTSLPTVTPAHATAERVQPRKAT